MTDIATRLNEIEARQQSIAAPLTMRCSQCGKGCRSVEHYLKGQIEFVDAREEVVLKYEAHAEVAWLSCDLSVERILLNAPQDIEFLLALVEELLKQRETDARND